MPKPAPACPDCKVPMDPGFIVRSTEIIRARELAALVYAARVARVAVCSPQVTAEVG